MKVLALMVFRHSMGASDTGSSSSSSSSNTTSTSSPIKLAAVTYLQSFSFFQRGVIDEHVRFSCRLVSERTTPGQRQTVQVQDNPFVVHSYVRLDGLSGCVVSDKEYPVRVAFSLINKTLQQYESTNPKWSLTNSDSTDAPEYMTKDIATFQEPAEADKVLKIQKDLDEIQDIMHRNIEEVLKRGETLDSLMERSDELSASSLHFYQQAKKQNQCCSYY